MWCHEAPYDCREVCGNGGSRLDPEQQARQHCSLPLYKGDWTPVSPEGALPRGWYMGRSIEPEEYAVEDGEDLDEFPQLVVSGVMDEPWESLHEGCPGGWLRCAYIESLRPFARHLIDQSGAHDSNPMLGPGMDPRIWEAIQHLELEERRALDWAARKKLRKADD